METRGNLDGNLPFNPSTSKGVIFDPLSDQLNNTIEILIVFFFYKENV